VPGGTRSVPPTTERRRRCSAFHGHGANPLSSRSRGGRSPRRPRESSPLAVVRRP
jgi:hypothetical protein